VCSPSNDRAAGNGRRFGKTNGGSPVVLSSSFDRGEVKKGRESGGPMIWHWTILLVLDRHISHNYYPFRTGAAVPHQRRGASGSRLVLLSGTMIVMRDSFTLAIIVIHYQPVALTYCFLMMIFCLFLGSLFKRIILGY
jgi:hypothetical protein